MKDQYKMYKLDKIELFLLVIFIASLSMLVCNILSIKTSYSFSLVNQTRINISLDDNEFHKAFVYGLIEELAINVSESHEYQLHKFDCTDFSKELIVRLKEKGIESRCNFGKLIGSEYPLHTWVVVLVGDIEIPVEATGGYIIDPSDYSDRYKTIKKNACL